MKRFHGSRLAFFSPAPLLNLVKSRLPRIYRGCLLSGLPFSRALLFLLSLAPLLPNPPTSVYAQPGWSYDIRLTSILGDAGGPKVVGYGTTLHLVWYQDFADSLRRYHEETFYKRSTDEGMTWGPNVMLSSLDTKTSVCPEIAVLGADVHVVWNDYGIGTMYRRSTDYGVTWGPIDTLLGNDLTFKNSIAAVGDSVYVVADAPSQQWNVYTWSTDRGVNWSPYLIISYGESQFVPLRVYPPYLHIAKDVMDSTGGCVKIYYLRSSDGGRSWDRDTLISGEDYSGSQFPAITVDYRGNPHVTWFDYRYSPYPWTGDIFYTNSSDLGKTWRTEDSLTVFHRAVGSAILAQGDTLHLVWEDDRHGFGTNFEIYYRMSTDLGETWVPEIRLTNALAYSIAPCLCLTQNFLHLVWVDERDDPARHPRLVYYKRKSTTLGHEMESPMDQSELGRVQIKLWPNPTKGRCWMVADVYCGPVLFVYDALGRFVKRLTSERGAGSQNPLSFFVWDGRDEQGREVSQGVYFIRVASKEQSFIGKVVVVR
jgi:hypothetical protein